MSLCKDYNKKRIRRVILTQGMPGVILEQDLQCLCASMTSTLYRVSYVSVQGLQQKLNGGVIILVQGHSIPCARMTRTPGVRLSVILLGWLIIVFI